MEGRNRADKIDKLFRLISEEKEDDVPCVFISYQRNDEDFAKSVAKYINDHQIDVFFDLEDIHLKKSNSPEDVTDSIKAGLKKSNYMIVIVSSTTASSPWVPFEIGYAYDQMAEKMKILRNRNLPIKSLPDYLKTKEILNGYYSLNTFLKNVRNSYKLYESKIQKGQNIKTFSSLTNPLNKYLENL
ncbi:toll/interleukin-1 receptor domain-containing protein [Crocinitomix algicola]|uniref:toll/interleukin-1 receptor domain-containing protein n=1 Tax=Crocinitomix algicola TaxID=1740263 RepID=UPI0008722F3D|nr:toll/interleukin-1 receptor domain-containing protein [Crocinitomix algicola]